MFSTIATSYIHPVAYCDNHHHDCHWLKRAVSPTVLVVSHQCLIHGSVLNRHSVPADTWVPILESVPQPRPPIVVFQNFHIPATMYLILSSGMSPLVDKYCVIVPSDVVLIHDLHWWRMMIMTIIVVVVVVVVLSSTFGRIPDMISIINDCYWHHRRPSPPYHTPP